jgi:signal transduction histidine kinase
MGRSQGPRDATFRTVADMPGTPPDRTDALLQAGLTLVSELSLDAVLQRIVALATSLTDARYGALGVLGPEGVITEFITVGLEPSERARIGHPPIGRGILGVLISDARTLRLPEISRDPRSYGFPPNHPSMSSFLGAPVMARGRVFGNIYLTEKQGAAEFTEEDEHTIEVLAAQAGVAIENARLHEESLQRERRLEAMAEIATATIGGRPVEEILSLVARRAHELLDADLATVAVPSGPDELLLIAAEGEAGDELRGTVFPLGQSISGDVVRTGDHVVVDDISADPRAAQPVVQSGAVGPAVFVPLPGTQAAPIGTLMVANGLEGGTFADADVTALRAFAQQAAGGVEYARAQDELRRLLVLEDRERIAKELHDGVIQALFAVGMGLQGTAALARDPDIERRMEDAVGEIDHVIRDLRNYIFGLRPGILADRQLDQALRSLAAEFEERTGVTTVVDVDVRVAAELSSKAADVVQLAREALSNVGRHAAAQTCRLALVAEDNQAVLEIDDDGTGFEPHAVRPGGQGLGNLRSRAQALGGTRSIASSPRAGTTVRVRLPLA